MYVAVTATDSVGDSSVIEIFNSLLECEPLKDLPKVSVVLTMCPAAGCFIILLC